MHNPQLRVVEERLSLSLDRELGDDDDPVPDDEVGCLLRVDHAGLVDDPDAAADPGVFVRDVVRGSPAANSGVLVGDVILSVDGEIPIAFASWFCERPYSTRNSSFSISPGVTGANSFCAIVVSP